MERHKLWDDRAEKLMERTFEKFGYGKKKEPIKEEKKIKESLQESRQYVDQVRETIDMNPERAYNMVYDLRTHVTRVDMDEDAREYILDELSMILDNMDADPDPGYDDEDEEMVKENSLLDVDDYNMLQKAIEEPVRKLIAGGHTKEDLLDSFKVMLGFDNVNEEDFNTTTQLSKDMDKATASADKKMGRVASRISTIAKLQDVLVSYTRELMKDADKVGEKELTLVLRKMLKNVNQLVSSGEGPQNENETENPEVDRAEDAARKAKIKALQVQLKALQKTQSME